MNKVTNGYIFTNYKTIFTIEDGTIKGGFGSSILEFAMKNKYKNNIKLLGIPHEFIDHGSIEDLQKYCKIDVESLISIFKNEL